MDLEKLSKKKLEFLVEQLIEMLLDVKDLLPGPTTEVEEETERIWEELKERLKFKTPFRKLILKGRKRK